MAGLKAVVTVTNLIHCHTHAQSPYQQYVLKKYLRYVSETLKFRLSQLLEADECYALSIWALNLNWYYKHNYHFLSLHKNYYINAIFCCQINSYYNTWCPKNTKVLKVRKAHNTLHSCIGSTFTLPHQLESENCDRYTKWYIPCFQPTSRKELVGASACDRGKVCEADCYHGYIPRNLLLLSEIVSLSESVRVKVTV